VLDEGHTIRNSNAQQTKAALNLEGHRRWVLTGKTLPAEETQCKSCLCNNIILCFPLGVSSLAVSGRWLMSVCVKFVWDVFKLVFEQ